MGRPKLPTGATHVQPGHFDPRIIHHEFWIDAHATIWRLDDLDTDHLHAIIAMLTARSLVLYSAELIHAFLREIAAREQGMSGAEQLAHELGQPSIGDLEPVEWLETTALLRAIRRVLRARG